jgi:hypothetical protein
MAELQELFAVKNCVRQTIRMLKPAMIFVGQIVMPDAY